MNCEMLLTNWEYPEDDITWALLNMPPFVPEAVVNIFSSDSWSEDARQVAAGFFRVLERLIQSTSEDFKF